MASIDDIKKNVLSENDVYMGWQDSLQMFEETYLYAGELAEQMLSKSGEEAFEDFANGRFGRDDLPKTVNTYPFGEKTSEVYPEFIGVCNGDDKLSGLFKAIVKQIKVYMSETYEGRDRKAITVFSDKWDPKYLKQSEALFLKAILMNNVYFNFFLVTDYGITRIPFMNDQQTEEYKRNFTGDRIEEAMSLRELIEENDLWDVEYTANQCDSFIPTFDWINYRYSFDFRNLRYIYEDNKGEYKRGKISESYALRFIRASLALEKVGGLNSSNRPTNYVQRVVDYGRFSFSWFDGMGAENSPEIADMVEALIAIISTLK